MKEEIRRLLINNLFNLKENLENERQRLLEQVAELKRVLIDLENQTGYIRDDSPTKKVGGDVLDGFEKIEHEYPLYSLSKAQSVEEIEEWIIRNKRLYNFEECYSVEYKFDGLSISLLYDNGKLVQAGTRGNGIVGEDVTEQVKTIRSVPLTISDKRHIIIQGEVVMKRSELEKYNRTAEEKLKNPRSQKIK